MIYDCCGENRKNAILNEAAQAVAAHQQIAAPNGVDYLEVLDQAAPAGVPRQQTLFLHCLYGLSLMNPRVQWTPDKLMIEGGASVTGVQITWVVPASSITASSPPDVLALLGVVQGFTDLDNVLVIRTDRRGDFSTYRLRLVNSAVQASENPFEVTETLAGFDPQLAAVEFCCKVECGPDFDCAPPAPNCPPAAPVPPPINYLAKDYGSFRSIILDRLNQLLPAWAGASEADFGVVLAELIAYVGDQLSYRQDAVATEAYLETARSRVSLRRHARLVDYHVHDGANARAWIQLQVAGSNGASVPLDRKLTRFYTKTPGMPSSVAVGANNEEAALLAGVTVFEPMQNATLFPEHNRISFYTWGDTGCCLPRGATEATLSGSLPNLQVGDVLIFQEVLGPQTGDPTDADLRRRCAVRLTQVTTKNGSGAPLVDSLFNPSSPAPVTEIQWSADDVLPFPLCLSSTFLDADGVEHSLTDVSVAFGNVVLADHGLSFSGVSLGTAPAPRLFQPPNPAADRCQPANPTPFPARFRPMVPDSPLTQSAPLTLARVTITPDPSLSANALMTVDPSQAVPSITLAGTTNGPPTPWTPEQDLLDNGESDQVFVVEVEADGSATLRFGDNVNGLSPDAGTSFAASYRIGNGAAGNVGPDSLVMLAAADARIQSCRNPLPAVGGTEPETSDQIRRRAPQAFLTQERAVTMADYDAMTELNPQVDRAVATLRWTGSWHTVFIAVEPQGAGNLTKTLARTLKKSLERYRLAGQDLQMDSPQYVSLEIELQICVDPNYFESDVEQSLLQVLGNGILPNGLKGFFYPDNFIFGQTVYLSPIYAAARSVAGVLAVTATKFQPQGVDTAQFLDTGEIATASLQVARLDNDPNYPDHGQLTLVLEGGK
jgi:hypothetical protein